MFASCDVCLFPAGIVDKHFKEKLPRVLGLGNGNPDVTIMISAVRGLMFGDYMVPGMTLVVFLQARSVNVLHFHVSDASLVGSLSHCVGCNPLRNQAISCACVQIRVHAK